LDNTVNLLATENYIHELMLATNENVNSKFMFVDETNETT